MMSHIIFYFDQRVWWYRMCGGIGWDHVMGSHGGLLDMVGDVGR